jgi:2,4-dienoyl-CoA reductase-like NADH-dependent reductase (Old Yellow Enzyme family)
MRPAYGGRATPGGIAPQKRPVTRGGFFLQRVDIGVESGERSCPRRREARAGHERERDEVLCAEAAIGHLRLKNRIVKSATHTNMANADGSPGETLPRHYAQLAKGGAGLIVAGFAYVNKAGQSYPRQEGIHRDWLIPAWRRITELVHEHGGRIALQIAHGGRQIQSKLLGRRAVGPSAFPNLMYFTPTRPMTACEIEETIRDFGLAAGRAKEAGFDAVQIHAAHGYLISSFLSPLTNWRRDEWGGDVNRRFRFLAEVYAAVRRRVGPRFPVLVKLNLDDFLWFGLQAKESFLAAHRLAALGVDGIEISGGVNESGAFMSRGGLPLQVLGRGRTLPARLYLRVAGWMIRPRDELREAYFLPLAGRLKPHLKVPLILVGGIRSLDMAEEILQRHKADFISLARPLIREPDLPNRWAAGDCRPAQCISCNLCLGEMERGSAVRCFAASH